MRAVVLGQIPDAHASIPVAANDFSLVGVNHHIIRGAPMTVASLNCARSRLPDLDRAVLRAGDHPFPFAMESDACDIPGMAFEGMERVGVRGFDVV